jgi:hypothetical protein
VLYASTAVAAPFAGFRDRRALHAASGDSGERIGGEGGAMGG